MLTDDSTDGIGKHCSMQTLGMADFEHILGFARVIQIQPVLIVITHREVVLQVMISSVAGT